MDAGNQSKDDPRLLFIYQEAFRGLQHQQALVESMNNRAGNLIFVASFASSLLGARALSDGVGFWDWFAITLLLGIGILIVLMLWPYYSYTFRLDPIELLDKYIDGDAHTSMSEMYRELTLRIEEYRINNWRIIQRLRLALQFSLILLLLEILAWLFSIAGIRSR